MNKIILTLVLALAGTAAAAQSWGQPTYNQSQGFTVNENPWGGSTIRYDDGSSAQVSRNPWGGTTIRHSDGSSISCSENPWGGTTCR